MKKLVALLLLTAVFVPGWAQKVKIKKEVVTVDGVEYALFQKDPIVRSGKVIKNTQGGVLLNMVLRHYTDPNAVTQSNPKGNVYYYEVTDPTSREIYFEYGGGFKALFKSFYAANVIKDDGSLDLESLKTIATRFGNEYSRKRSDPK
ncbi:MAG: hypothetical protein JJ975_14560 [Bacteroidia bacterium]|nr:hypothetical protein [Bacteroidia bacterium]